MQPPEVLVPRCSFPRLTPLKTIRLWPQDLGAGSAKDSCGTKSYVLVGELSLDNIQVDRILAGQAWIWEAGDGIVVLVSSFVLVEALAAGGLPMESSGMRSVFSVVGATMVLV